MLKTRYLEVKSELERLIVSGRWNSKLPGVFDLGRLLGVNHQTVSKALKLLAEEGKVSIRGTRGTFITKNHGQRRRYGVIGVVGLLHDQASLSASFTEVERVVSKHGCTALGLTRGQASFDHLEKMPVDGFVFGNSVLTEEMISRLRDHGIPFISLNRFSEIPGVSWVDFDTEAALGDSLEYLHSLDYSRIVVAKYAAPLEEHGRREAAVFREVSSRSDDASEWLYLRDADYLRYYEKYDQNCHAVFAQEIAEKLLLRNAKPMGILAQYEVARELSTIFVSKGLEPDVDFGFVVTMPDDAKPSAVKGARAFLRRDRLLLARRAAQYVMDYIEQSGNSLRQELVPMELQPVDSLVHA